MPSFTPDDERADPTAFAVLQVERHPGYEVQVRPQAVTDLGKLTFRDDAILVDRSQGQRVSQSSGINDLRVK